MARAPPHMVAPWPARPRVIFVPALPIARPPTPAGTLPLLRSAAHLELSVAPRYAALAPLEEMPVLALRGGGRDVKRGIVDAVRRSQYSIDGKQCCFDDRDITFHLILKANRPGFRIRLLMDLSQISEPSCATQNQRLLELFDEGVEIRALKPNDALHSRMHAKTWLLDNCFCCVGTGNATHNSSENNYEECVFSRCRCVVEAARGFFAELWRHPRTIAVTREDLCA